MALSLSIIFIKYLLKVKKNNSLNKLSNSEPEEGIRLI